MEAFFHTVLPLLPHPVIVHVGEPESDVSTPPPGLTVHDVLAHPNLHHWFADDWVDPKHKCSSKLTVMPVGFASSGLFGDHRAVADWMTSALAAADTELEASRADVLVDFHHSGPAFDWSDPLAGPVARHDRWNALRELAPNDATSMDKPRNATEAWRQRSRFRLHARPAADGVDSAATWETYAARAVPVLRRSLCPDQTAVCAARAGPVEFVEDARFPVMLVDEWRDLNRSALERAASIADLDRAVSAHRHARTLLRLTTEWWRSAIEDQQEQCLSERRATEKPPP